VGWLLGGPYASICVRVDVGNLSIILWGFKEMRVLGLDISSVCTGWAIVEAEDSLDPVLSKVEIAEVTAKGVIKFGKNLNDSQKMYWLVHQIVGLIKLYNPEECAIENVFLGKNFMTAKVLDRLAGAVQSMWYNMKGKSVTYYYATSVRPSIGVKGNCQKEDVIKAVNEKFKFRPAIEDNNEADAVAVAYHAWKVAGRVEEEAPEGSFGGEKEGDLGITKRRIR